MELNELVDAVNNEPNIDFSEEIELYNIPKIPSDYMRCFTSHYVGLSKICKILDIGKVLEIGTGSGASSIAMAKNADHVDTFGVDVEQAHLLVIPKMKIDFHIFSKPSDCLNVKFNEYDFIFIDIDHSGYYEPLIHKKIIESGYKGFVVYDDISMNDGMKKFWDGIENEKYVWNWNIYGDGMVKY